MICVEVRRIVAGRLEFDHLQERLAGRLGAIVWPEQSGAIPDKEPYFLLAYIAYNTGNEAQAGEYLATAEQRAGADDPLIKAWRRSWKLPPAGATEPAPQPDANK